MNKCPRCGQYFVSNPEAQSGVIFKTCPRCLEPATVDASLQTSEPAGQQEFRFKNRLLATLTFVSVVLECLAAVAVLLAPSTAMLRSNEGQVFGFILLVGFYTAPVFLLSVVPSIASHSIEKSRWSKRVLTVSIVALVIPWIEAVVILFKNM